MAIFKKIALYYHTLRYLRLTQISYRLYYLLRKQWRKRTAYQFTLAASHPPAQPLDFKPFLPAQRSYEPPLHFTFLNLSQTFSDQIDWNFSSHGKLWTYNLNYFDFLLQAELSTEEGLSLIHAFNQHIEERTEGLEPYPISLRVINWIKFISQKKLTDETILRSLYSQLKALHNSLEYHLLGNHLLENGFALLFGACFFQDRRFLASAEGIIRRELQKQILADGGHFERSTMYHQIILHRILDCINLLQHNGSFGHFMLPNLQEKGGIMLGWLQQMTYRYGSIPLVNDSTFGIAPTSAELLSYAKSLGIQPVFHPLKESGYRKWSSDTFEMVMDVGEIGPDYIPGHAHSDTLSFELYLHDLPFIVDPGISTYEKTPLRQWQRSTSSHNTVMIDDRDQTEVWGGFRVARRAYPLRVEEENNTLAASHTGYWRHGIQHRRTFRQLADRIEIIDDVKGGENKAKRAFFHFHPALRPIQRDHCIEVGTARISFQGQYHIEIADYDYAPAFNTLVPAQKLILTFEDNLHTIITP